MNWLIWTIGALIAVASIWALLDWRKGHRLVHDESAEPRQSYADREAIRIIGQIHNGR